MLIRIVIYVKQNTAYEMRISDWSSDVCSSDLAEDGGSQRLLRAGSDGHFLRLQVQSLESRIMHGHRLAQFRQAGHGGILIPPVPHRVGRLVQHVFRPAEIWKALAKVHRVQLPRKAGHGFKDGGGQVGKQRVHSGLRSEEHTSEL